MPITIGVMPCTIVAKALAKLSNLSKEISRSAPNSSRNALIAVPVIAAIDVKSVRMASPTL